MDIPAEKVCSKCYLPKPLDDFHRDKNGKHGRVASCKACVHDRAQTWYGVVKDQQNVKRRARRIADQDTYRQYDKARYQRRRESRIAEERQRRLLQPELVKAIARKTYLKHRPKRLQEMKAYRLTNLESIRLQRKRHYQANKPFILLKCKTYRLSHLQEEAERSKRYRQTHKKDLTQKKTVYQVRNRQRINLYRRTWSHLHPDIIRDRMKRRRAKIKGLNLRSEHINTLEIAERDNWICHICKRKISKENMHRNYSGQLTLDHLIPKIHGGPHLKENVAIAHRSCNSRMGAGRLPAQLRLLP